MNYFILIIIICFFIIYKINTKLYINTITNHTNIPKIGILKNDGNIKLLHIFANILNNNNIKLQIEYYDNNSDMYYDLNNNIIKFAITYEDIFINNCLGINKHTKYNNINYVCGLIYNFFYFLVKKQENNSLNVYNLLDIVNYNKNTNNNFIIGTDSNSLKYLKFLFSMYNIKLTNYDSNSTDADADADVDADTNTNTGNENNIKYVVNKKKILSKKYNDNVINGIFLLGNYNDSYISSVIKDKNNIFLNLNLDYTIFNEGYNMFFSNDEIILNNYYYLINQFSFSTIKTRLLLISNNNNNNNNNHNYNHTNLNTLVENICELYFKNFNIISNKYLNLNKKNIFQDNYLIEPLDMMYINDNIQINDGAYKYYKKIQYIKDTEEYNNKFKCYWKYDNIGLKKFVL